MSEIAVKAEDLRLPRAAREALEQGRCVVLTRYGRPTSALLSIEAYDLVAPLLELIEAGVVVSPELLMTKADIALARDLGQDDDSTPGEEALIDGMLHEARSAGAG